MTKAAYSRVTRLLGVNILAALFIFPLKGIAQKDYTASTTTGNGLSLTKFTTPHGTITAYLTDDLAPGKTISGTVEANPVGKNDKERNQNKTILDDHEIEFAGQKIKAGAKRITCNVPGQITQATKTFNLHYKGKVVASTELSISSTAPSIPNSFTIPTGGLRGSFLEIKGPGDGVFSPDDYVKIGETILPVIAKSMYKVIVLNTHDKTGMTNITCRENKTETTCPFRNIDLEMTAPKLNLRRGETTQLHVVVRGLEGIKENKVLDLENTTNSVVTLTGGETQHIPIPHEEIREDGTFTIDRTLTGITPGSFVISSNIVWSGVCNSIPTVASLILVNPEGATQITEQPEILTGKCHDEKDNEEPGPENVIAVNNEGKSIKILAPKNVGDCPIEIFCVDANGKKIPATSVFLEPGQGIESYMPPEVVLPANPNNPGNEVKYLVAQVVFQCNSIKDGNCKLQMDHWDQDYKIPRGKITGKCDDKGVEIGTPEGPLKWIRNTGTCPVEIYSTKNGKEFAKISIAPGVMLPQYNPRTHDDKVYFRCAKSDGSCEIELDDSKTHPFPLPEGKKVDVVSVYRTLKGDCDGEESVISVTNQKELWFRGIKNTGTCPVEIYGRDELDEKHFGIDMVADGKQGLEKKVRTEPLVLAPGEEAAEYITDGFSNRLVLKCPKGGDNCSIQILDRTVEYLKPINNPPPEPKLKPLQLTIRGECAQESGEKNLISLLSGDHTSSIKWITNTGDCPVEIFCTVFKEEKIKSLVYKLEPGQTIESYHPPKNAMGVYFRCVGKGNNCSIQVARPLGY